MYTYPASKKFKGIRAGESITFEAQVVSGKPGYSYQWSRRKEGDDSWSSLEGDGSSWTWNIASGDEGTYAIRCQATYAQDRTGEVTWEGFTVSAP